MDAARSAILPDASGSISQVQYNTSEPKYFVKVSPGKKKFAPKVRSGCLTCKRRRVKCDEARPSCNKCLRTGKSCDGYHTPQAWIFKSSREAGADQTEERPGSSNSLNWEKGAVSRGVSLPIEYLDISQNAAIYDKPGEIAKLSTSLFQRDQPSQQAFEFYILNTARSVDAIGPMGSLWVVWVPQLAQHYDSMKHMMLAAGLLDKASGFPTALPPLDRDTVQLTKTRALAHYQSAITALLRDQHPTIVLILAALIACAWEQELGNFAAAKMHAEAAVKLNSETLNNHSSLTSKLSQLEIDIRRAVPLSVDMCKLRGKENQNDGIAASKSSQKEPGSNQPLNPRPISFTSLDESLSLVHDKLTKYCATSNESNTAVEFQRWLLRWEATSIAYYPEEPETAAQKDATHLFWFVGLAVLPESVTGSRSYASSPIMVEEALKKARRLVDQDIEAQCKVSERVGRALSLLLGVIINQFSNTTHAKEAAELLQRAKTGKS